jgi:hypothetical protein
MDIAVRRDEQRDFGALLGYSARGSGEQARRTGPVPSRMKEESVQFILTLSLLKEPFATPRRS